MNHFNRFKIENNIFVTLTEKQFNDFWHLNLVAMYIFSFHCDKEWFVSKKAIKDYYSKYKLYSLEYDIDFLTKNNIIKDINENYFICNPRIIGYKMEENIKASEVVRIIFPDNPDKEDITTYAWRLNIIKDKATHFKNKRWFVKLFQDIPTLLYEDIGSDWKYVIKIKSNVSWR